jgi:ribosome-binding factor A
VSVPRTTRLAGQIQAEASEILAREVHDPGIGFVTLTRAEVTPDLQLARLYYTTLGDPAARRTTERALQRVTPFVRRQLGQRLQLRRVPDVQFVFDQSIAHQARVEEILREIHATEAATSSDDSEPGAPDHHDD